MSNAPDTDTGGPGPALGLDDRTVELDEGPVDLVVLAVLSVVAGAISGLVCAVFRLALVRLDDWRNALIDWAHDHALLGFLCVVLACAGCVTFATWLVRRFSPYATGSGIPHVEAVLKEGLPYAPLRLIPVKFVGGLLAIGAGLALGREGPSVQMGASISHVVGKVFKRDWEDCRTLLAAGAGAGLATAFNAPIAGATFVLEELVRRFDTRIMIAVFGASAAAICVARTMLGQSPDFAVAELPFPGARSAPFFIALGIVAGLLGVVYNMAILDSLKGLAKLPRVPLEAKAAIIGILVAILAWFWPAIVGGGDPLTQNTLDGSIPLGAMALMFAIRFGLGPASYAAATPGGLFAPLLVVGAQSGFLFGVLCQKIAPGVAPDPKLLAVTGMAALFTGVVRAPLTGIILVIELTGGYTQLLPMLSACFTAMLIPTLLRNAPIYDALRDVPGRFKK